jgi:hypothetical protein
MWVSLGDFSGIIALAPKVFFGKIVSGGQMDRISEQLLALDIAIELWEWLASTGDHRRIAWPGWAKYDARWKPCPLCAISFDCAGCPLITATGTSARYGCTHLGFKRWDTAKDDETRKNAAARFLGHLRRARAAL